MKGNFWARGVEGGRRMGAVVTVEGEVGITLKGAGRSRSINDDTACMMMRR